MSSTHFDNDLLSVMWIIACGIMVFLMQLGFAFVETGMVRYKNTVNVAVKNLIDVLSGILAFWLIGYSLMFGEDCCGIIGVPQLHLFNLGNYEDMAMFFFQAMFAATATTIISGAVAERIKFYGYTIISLILGVLIFPVVGHWVWKGWLHSWGYHDYAGVSVVHTMGAMVGLAGTIMLGPRLGKFSRKKHPFSPSNYNYIVFGTLLLIVGWFAFNGGANTRFNLQVSSIMVNTLMGAIGGGLSGIVYSLITRKNIDIILVSFSIIAGLVVISGGADIFSPIISFILGVSAVIPLLLGMKILEISKIDDPVNVIATHGFAGIWGAIATGLFGNIPSTFTLTNRLDFVVVQIIGVSTIAAWSFGIGFLVFWFLRKLHWLRVSPKHEVLGLNMTEHNAKLPWTDIIETITKIHATGNLRLRIPVEHSSEAGVVAEFINRLLMELEEREKVLERMATTDRLTGVYNRVAFEKIVEMEEGKGHYTVGVLDIDKFKRINDTYGHQAGDLALKVLVEILKDEIENEDYIIRWGGEEFLIFMKNRSLAEGAWIMEKLRLRVEGNIFPIFKHLTVSIGVSAPLHPLEPFEEVFKRADDALYCAKNGGRNRVCVGTKEGNINYLQFVKENTHSEP